MSSSGWKDAKLMRIRIAAVVFVTMCTGQMALAGGIDVPPNFYDWTGVYVGANVGYAGGSVTDSDTGTQSFSGALAGGQIGANLQYRSLIFGAEVDGDWSGQQGSTLRCPSTHGGWRRHAYASGGHTTTLPTMRPEVLVMCISAAMHLTGRPSLQRTRHGSQALARNLP